MFANFGRVVARLHPDPLGELWHSPRPSSHYYQEGREVKGKERVGNRERGEGR